MRGPFVLFVILLLIVLIAVASESEVIAGSSKGGPINISLSSTEPDEGVATAMVPVVDLDGDGDELLPCSEAPGDCTLRSAIIHAIQRAKPTTIHFAEHMVIDLERPLPTLTQDGLKIVVPKGQEVRVNGNGWAAPVFHIAAKQVHLEGLRIYGAGAGHPHILLNGPAQDVMIARNLIGDDDAPAGNCDPGTLANAGIYVQSEEPLAENGVRAWIYGNIIECHRGDGLVIMADRVNVGINARRETAVEQKNTIRENGGAAVRLDHFGGNTVQNNLIYNNAGGSFIVTNFDNNILNNEIR